MGNRPSAALRKRSKEQKPAAAALPLDVAIGVNQQLNASDVGALETHEEMQQQQEQQAEETGEEQSAEAAALSDNQNEDSDSGSDGEDGEGEEQAPDEEEDPLRFFRRLSSLSNGESEGERESQDLFMGYTQALLLKERGDYAAASTLLRLVRNFKSLEVEAQHHLAQCLLMLDPDLGCFGDEIVECLERVVSAESADLADDSAFQQMQRESTELLAHVLVSRGYAERARELLAASAQSNQYEDQASIAHFQTAICELALGDVSAARAQLAAVDCRTSLPLMHVDAQVAERALADAIWQRTRSGSRSRSSSSGRPGTGV